MHEVALADGGRIAYSKLLIATGAHPVAPGFPQGRALRPLTLRTMQDADLLRDVLSSETCRSVLVSGTSMVGLKALEACLDQGVKATLLGRSPHILRGTAHPLVARRFEELLFQRGVALRLSRRVVDATGEGPHGNPRGCTVSFDDGGSERFDAVILAQGVQPNLSFVPTGAQVGGRWNEGEQRLVGFNVLAEVASKDQQDLLREN